MKTARLTVILGGLLWSAMAAAGGSEAGNGGGLAEKNLIFAGMHLHEYLRLCLGTPLCQLTASERELLSRIDASLPKERAAVPVFGSEKNVPGMFWIDGQVRVAKTGDRVGDPIYVNSDLLYTEAAPRDFRAMQIPMAASVLVHELGHHQGVKDHAALDVLGTKVQTLLLLQTVRSEFWNGNAVLVTFQLNLVKKDADKKRLGWMDSMVLEYGDELYPLGDRLRENIRCPGGRKALGLRLYNVHEERGVTFDAAMQLIRKPIEAWYILSCAAGQESDHGNLEMELVFRKSPDPLPHRFLPELTSIRQVSCFKDSRVCK